MNTRPPLLFALHGTQEYAARVSRYMGSSWPSSKSADSTLTRTPIPRASGQ